MKTKIIDIKTLNEFASNNYLFNFFESEIYADVIKLNKEKNMIIGVYNENVLCAVSIVLIKKLTFSLKYAFLPKGFITNYNDSDNIMKITKSLSEFFTSKKFAFIKISPEIPLYKINYKDKNKEIFLNSKNICNSLESNKYIIPSYNNYYNKYNISINLKDFNVNNLSEITKLRLLNFNNNLPIRKGNIDELKYFNLSKKETSLYKKYLENNNLDFLLIEIDYNIYLKLLNNEYEAEIETNKNIIKEYKENINDEKLLNIKLLSDNKIHDLKDEITNVTRLIFDENNANKKIIISSIITFKYFNKISIIKSTYGLSNSNVDGNYFITYLLIQFYKKQNFEYLNLNSISENELFNSYDYRLSFNPEIIEYIPEYDLVLNKKYYDLLNKLSYLNKKD
jgi:lipid II:glycine glycyltransferase (peptidoglycan interpeptide bridge formation enzyme)